MMHDHEALEGDLDDVMRRCLDGEVLPQQVIWKWARDRIREFETSEKLHIEEVGRIIETVDRLTDARDELQAQLTQARETMSLQERQVREVKEEARVFWAGNPFLQSLALPIYTEGTAQVAEDLANDMKVRFDLRLPSDAKLRNLMDHLAGFEDEKDFTARMRWYFKTAGVGRDRLLRFLVEFLGHAYMRQREYERTVEKRGVKTDGQEEDLG